MDKFMLLETETLTPEEIRQAINEARKLRSEAAWNAMNSLCAFVSKLFHTKSDTSSGSGLAHSA